jgi:O-antigen/teichoic acid export membrane protein
MTNKREDSVEATSGQLRQPSRGCGRAPVAAFGIARFGPRNLARSRTVWQAGGFAVAGLLANAFAVIATALLTRNLTTAEFGSYSFAVSLLFFVAILFEFGLFVPAARLTATMDSRDRRDVVGAALMAYLPVGAAFSATVILLSFWVDGWFNVDAGQALRIAAPAAIAFPFVLVLQQLTQGLDRLHVTSVATAGTQMLLVVLLAVWLGLGGGLSTPSALVLRAVALLIASVGGALWLKPAFGAVARWSRELVRQAREWGFQLFLGRVLSIGTYNMDVLMLGIWTTSRWVGFYVLAGSLATASGLPVSGMAAALFARMAREPVIPRRWLIVATAMGAACAAAAWLLADPVIRVFFTPRYLPAVGLVLPLAVAQLVRGVTGIFNTFLSAHGRGHDLRNAGLVLTLSNLAFNFVLIPPFGAQGAAWASLFALIANLIAHAVFYRRRFPLRPTGSVEVT